MHKNKGRSQQIRGQKRRAKVLKMKKNRNPNSVKLAPGSKYLDMILYSNEEKVEGNALSSI
jgi:hypothetical protein